MTDLELEQALESLVPGDRTGTLEDLLLAAVREAGRRRKRNSLEGGAVIRALHDLDPDRWSWRAIERETGFASGTARRWSEPPTPED